MYEFTLGGSWFRWSLLDRTSKWLAGGSFAAAGVAVLPASLSLGSHAYELGYRLGSRGRTPAYVAAEFSPMAAIWLVVFSIVSGVLWWRFSRRQDELFNRVQNWALAMAGAWSATLLSLWALLNMGGVLPPVSSWGIVGTFYLLTCVFWFAAVRRWV